MKSAFLLLTFLFAAPAAFGAVKKEKVEYRHQGVLLEGYLVYDDSVKGERPGILVFPEWWGLNDYPRKRAEELARLGYVAFAADMYGKGVTTREPSKAAGLATPLKKKRELMRGRANATLDVLRGTPLVDKGKIAAIGYCFGGTTALELARSGADLVGVVSFHGNLDTPNPGDAKNIKAKVLALQGGNDPFVPTNEVLAFEDEMRKGQVDWQLITYGGAVHSFTNPESDSFHLKGAAYNARADKRSWEHMKLFFNEIFGK